MRGVARLVRVARGVERGDRFGERLRRLGEPDVEHRVVELRQHRHRAAQPRRHAERRGELERARPALLGLLGEGALEPAIERRRQAVAEQRHRGVAVQLGVLLERGRGERPPPGHRLVGHHAERVEVRRRPDRHRVVPLLGRHVRRRADRRVGVGQALLDLVVVGRRRRRGQRRHLRRVEPAIAVDHRRRVVVARRQRDPHRRRQRRLVEQLGDAEVEELGQELAGALDHHHVRRLEVAVHDAALVRGLDHLRDAVEERHQLLDRQRSALAQPAVERGALHHLHRDPEQAVVVLDPERVDVRGIGVVEPRRELGLTHEPLQHDVVAAQPLVQHLDDRLAAEQRLLAAIHRAEAAFANALAKDELAERSAAEILALRHPMPTLSPLPRIRSRNVRAGLCSSSRCAWCSPTGTSYDPGC